MKFGIYEVEEEYDEKGRYKGYRCGVVESTGKQGKLYLKSDGTEHYRAKPKPKPEKGDENDNDLDLLQ